MDKCNLSLICILCIMIWNIFFVSYGLMFRYLFFLICGLCDKIIYRNFGLWIGGFCVICMKYIMFFMK